MTDTALYADVVLPATTFLEGYDFAQGVRPDQHASSARPVIDAVGEARSNADVFGELCARLGVLERGRADRRARSDWCACWMRCRARSAPICAAASRRRRRSGWRPMQFVDVFPNTPDRKVNLFRRALEAAAPIGLYRFQPDPATERVPARR